MSFSFLFCSHSDVNLVELGNEAVKEDDNVSLLEGGIPKVSLARSQSTSVRTNLIRYANIEAKNLQDPIES